MNLPEVQCAVYYKCAGSNEPVPREIFERAAMALRDLVESLTMGFDEFRILQMRGSWEAPFAENDEPVFRLEIRFHAQNDLHILEISPEVFYYLHIEKWRIVIERLLREKLCHIEASSTGTA